MTDPRTIVRGKMLTFQIKFLDLNRNLSSGKYQKCGKKMNRGLVPKGLFSAFNFKLEFKKIHRIKIRFLQIYNCVQAWILNSFVKMCEILQI